MNKRTCFCMNRPSILFVSLVFLVAGGSCGRPNREVPNKSAQVNRTTTTNNRPGRIISTTNSNSSTRLNQVAPLPTNKKYTGTQIFEMYNPAVFTVYTSTGVNDYQGSGFFIGRNVAVSNYHVFKGTGRGLEHIKLYNGTLCKVNKVIAYDDEEDYIVFEVNYDCPRFIPLASSKPMVGEKCYAIGSPRGLENTFSSGEISQLRGANDIQISVPIDHGSSGGVLLNEYGEAIGITSAGLDDSGANLNFAISIDLVRKYK